MVNACANCLDNKWEAAEESEIKRCSRCKFLHYCSVQCQKEHWVKVHKNHCKYLGGTKRLPLSWHDSARCPGCREVGE